MYILLINALKSKLQYSNPFQNASMPNERKSTNSAELRHNFLFSTHFNSKTTKRIFTIFLHDIQGAPIKNNPLEKILYFSHGSTDLSQTFRLCTWIFTQHILQILLKYFIWFNRYSSLNFKVHFSSEHTIAHWIFTNNESNFAELFINSSNVLRMNIRCL